MAQLPHDIESLHPETQVFVREVIDNQLRGDEDWNYTRQHTSETIAKMAEDFKYDYKGSRRDLVIPSPIVEEGLAAWVYTPANCDKNPTILIYYHGGGWVLFSRQEVDPFVKMLTESTNCIVVSVDYRLAPENKFPAALDDTITAAKWVLENREALGGSTLSKVGVIGDSGGGTLATSVAHDVPGIAFEVLIYPAADMRVGLRESYKKYAEGYLLTAESLYWFVKHYLNNEAEKLDPRASPILRPKLDHLPPTLLVLTTHDVLFDEGIEYGQKLKEAGVPTEIFVLEGVIHTIVLFPSFFKETLNKVCKKIAEFVTRQCE